PKVVPKRRGVERGRARPARSGRGASLAARARAREPAPAARRRRAVLPGGAKRRSVLDYLDWLVAALLARADGRVARLLRDPLARRLPQDVREEALAFMRLPSATLRAPIRAMRYRYILQELEQRDPDAVPGAQLELPFAPPLPPAMAALALPAEYGGGWTPDEDETVSLS
ncbi:MAG: hypothetical protein M3373_13945, partial [Gemmatimonadota bacterium]|nr:hypothetical protein [Gemmatimonadota bacterium]